MKNVISESEFIAWTANWELVEFNQEEYLPYFKTDKELHLGFFFELSDTETLFSTPGVTKIKVRFGLDHKASDNKKFVLILFGTDAIDERHTPYYISNCPDFRSFGDPGPYGNVPNVLVNSWQKYWRTIGEKSKITRELFTTYYGFLKGYNYSIKELIDSLFMFKKMPILYVNFVLHKYRSIKYSDEEEYAFGLLFQAVLDKYPCANTDDNTETAMISNEELAVRDSDDDDSSGYYDLSAPCPRTCHD